MVESKGGKPCLSGHVATYIPSCLGIVRVVPLPRIKVGNCGSCVRGDVPVEHLGVYSFGDVVAELLDLLADVS